jgi:hypothetical protein
MSDNDHIDDPIPHIRAAVLARLRQLHADPGGEWRSTVGPLVMFAGEAVSKLAILTGERDGLADLMADGADPEIFDDAASALTALWQIVQCLAGIAEE